MVEPSLMIKDKSRKTGYAHECKQCRKLRRLANLDKFKQRDAEDYQKNRELRLEQVRERYSNDPEKYRKISRKTWKVNKPLKRVQDAHRRAAQNNATVSWADKSVIKQLYETARELELADGIPRQVDHIVPLRNKLVCGLHVEHNLQILTKAENQKKKNTFKVG